jgi:Uri superfamily endonuclease
MPTKPLMLVNELCFPGTYLLLFLLHQSCALTVGCLGRFNLSAGFYGYVGSALGPSGLRVRLRHHLKAVKRPHWHVDYLALSAPVTEIWMAQGNRRREHDWAMVLGQIPGAIQPIPRFGASDCRCSSHLFYYSSMPSLDILRKRLKARFPEDNLIRAISFPL